MLSQEGVEAESPSAKQVTVMVLGARVHHPAGLLAPGLLDIMQGMQQLYQQLEEDPKVWGFLGHTPALVSSEDSANNTIIWLLYWETPEALHHFAISSMHPKLVQEYQRQASASGYHVGIMHEVYDVPARHWETIYLNMRPFAMGGSPRCLLLP
ncbi:hypothetical protein A1O3_01805 [Capronia epimyces CBS 606.96]|uniref:ABM domain-containing protein n=1 Tax=Capronia epimyces CBS 606.96 TaxID=1182542 RepID=W9YKZ5_9EURO|nr:uncharacterized protein A1O3_01805 [Capronia epimyces CBS 606.96]EXJ93248.1 hypothetical protein A1O3_01805 [Capronia epimyces CBS 606.96]